MEDYLWRTIYGGQLWKLNYGRQNDGKLWRTIYGGQFMEDNLCKVSYGR